MRFGWSPFGVSVVLSRKRGHPARGSTRRRDGQAADPAAFTQQIVDLPDALRGLLGGVTPDADAVWRVSRVGRIAILA